MAKKFCKFLAFTAVIAAAGAGAAALNKKFKDQNIDDDFDDDDFDDDFEDLDIDRGYTAIPLETEAVDEALSEATEETEAPEAKKSKK